MFEDQSVLGINDVRFFIYFYYFNYEYGPIFFFFFIFFVLELPSKAFMTVILFYILESTAPKRDGVLSANICSHAPNRSNHQSLLSQESLFEAGERERGL